MKNSSKHAFLLVELLVAIALISAVFVTLFFLQSKLLQVKQDGIMKVRATYYAQEAFEAIRALRAMNGWSALSSLTLNTSYYATLSDNAWSLGTTAVAPDAPTNQFTRTIQFASVKRQNDQEGIIDPNGSYTDGGTRKVTVTVSWDGGAKSVVLDTYITDWTSSL